jgi:hypothetical protein
MLAKNPSRLSSRAAKAPKTEMLLDASSEDIYSNLRMKVDSLPFALRQLLPDHKKSIAEGAGAILLTGWGFGKDDEQATQMPVDWGAMTFALKNAYKHKLARMLNITLKPRGVFACEVIVCGVVKGTAFDPDGKAELSSAAALG